MDEIATLYKAPEGYAAAKVNYENMLNKIAVPYELRTVETRFGPTQVIVAGPESGPPVVLLHGWSVNAPGCWWPHINVLAKTYRIYAPDVIGQPGQSAPVQPPTGGTGYPQWLSDVMDGLNVAEADFVGISFGGWLILKFSTFAPRRIKKAVLMGPAGFVNFSLATFNKLMFYAPLQNRERTRKFLKVIGAPAWKVQEEVIDDFKVTIKYFKFPRLVTYLPGRLSDEELSQLTAPTLLLVGQYDSIFKPQPLIERAKQILPNLKDIQVIPDAGHMLPYEQPEIVNRALLNFLA